MAAFAPPNLELLRTFVVAEATPTLSAAAAARHVTKSAVSQQLKTLEAQLGVVLFEKVGRNVRPTEAARELAFTLRTAFSAIDDSLEAARELQGAIRGDVRIGAPRPFARVWLRPRLAELLRVHEALVLDVAFGIPTDLERALGAGDLDLAVLVRAPESAAIDTAPLFVETFEAVASKAYLKAHGAPRSADEFASHRLIVFDRDLPMHAAWWRATFGGRSALRGAIACRVASLDEMLGLASAGVGIVVLPDYFVAAAIASGEVVPVRPHGAAKRAATARNAIVLAWRRGVVGSARVRAVRDALLARRSDRSRPRSNPGGSAIRAAVHSRRRRRSACTRLFQDRRNGAPSRRSSSSKQRLATHARAGTTDATSVCMTGRALLPLLLLAAGCSAELASEESTARVTQPIVNGTPSPASDDSVVFISMNGSNDEFCTGTLITPNLVLTARHCVSAMDESSECGTFTTQSAPSTLSIAIGATHGPRIATAKTIFVDNTKSTSGCSNDIALFQLDKDVPNAKISPVRLTKLTIGEPARTAGYGDDGSGKVTPGRYQKTGIKIDSVGPASYTYKTKTGTSIPVTVPPGEVVTGESTCFGDSGGPLFDAAGNVIGVTSRGVDGECKDRPSIYSDTESHAKLITDAATTAGHPLKQPGSPTKPADATPSTDEEEDVAAEEEEDEDETEAPAKPKKKSTRGAPASAGCSTAPGSSSSPFALGALVLGAALTLRRRRRA